MTRLIFGEMGEVCPHSAAYAPTYPRFGVKSRIAWVILQAPNYFTEDWIKNDDIGRLAQKVSMVSIDQRPLNEEPEIVITTKDGRTFRHQVDCALGDPANPVSEQGILDKYIKLATRQTDLKTAETLKHLVLTIDQPRHLSRLRHLLHNDLRCVQI